MNCKCLICGAPSEKDRCAEHAAKWQRRFFFPCKYCGGHVKSYKAKRCRRPACLSQAMREATALRHGERKPVTPHRRYTMGETTATASGWARKLGISPALATYHLSRGKTIAELLTQITKKRK